MIDMTLIMVCVLHCLRPHTFRVSQPSKRTRNQQQTKKSTSISSTWNRTRVFLAPSGTLLPHLLPLPRSFRGGSKAGVLEEDVLAVTLCCPNAEIADS